jgi:hypothetical protein
MDHVRVGGVCLLLLIIALALPINALAQTPQPATSSASEQGLSPWGLPDRARQLRPQMRRQGLALLPRKAMSSKPRLE